MTEVQPKWMTYSFRVNAKTRKSVAIQARFPLSEEEWNVLISELELMKLGVERGRPVQAKRTILNRRELADGQ